MTMPSQPSPDHVRRVLRERAQRLAIPPPQPGTAERIRIVEFGLAHERYAVDARHVRDVQPLRELTPLPCTPPFLRGLVNVRGRLVAVVDLKKFFGLPERGITDLHRVVVLQGADIELGLLADTVEDVHELDVARIQPTLATLTGIREDYVHGVTAERLVLLDAEAILSDPRLVVNEDVES
jgi:purine-binding chemotaxis protein CheW